MKPVYFLKVLVLFMGFAFFITGCQKFYDFVVTHPGAEN
jgi:hypothetical protein